MSRSTTKKKLWNIFAEFIRLRDSKDGFGTCISCGKMVSYPNSTGNWQACHYFPRSTTFAGLYFDEKNVNGGCSYCNKWLGGNIQGYREGLIKKYGPKILDDLAIKKMSRQSLDEFQMGALILHYKKLVKQMKIDRGMISPERRKKDGRPTKGKAERPLVP